METDIQTKQKRISIIAAALKYVGFLSLNVKINIFLALAAASPKENIETFVYGEEK